MGAHSSGRRALAGFFGLAIGVVGLFWLIALVALRPADGLTWVQVPDLTADLRLDAGLQTKPLKAAIVAEVIQDQAIDGAASSGALAVAPALSVAPPPSLVAVSQPPAQRLVATPSPAPQPAIPSQPTAGATPSPTQAPSPTPTITPAPSAPPVPTATPTSNPTPRPTPTPAPTPAPTTRFAVTWASESVAWSRNNGSGSNRCSQGHVAASGSFRTNGVGGSVYYGWVHYDLNGKFVSWTNESPIRINPGDTGTHSVVPDNFSPQQGGSEQLVFLSPYYSVPAQSWSCAG